MTPIDPSIGPDRARELFRAELAEVRTDAELQALRNRWVGRKASWVAAFMDALATATPELKKTLGKGANELKKEAEAAITEREAALASTRRPANAVDITLPGRAPMLGPTPTPKFQQVEGLVVGKGITVADLKGPLLAVGEGLVGEGTATRARPSFFPYTEPSAEVDIRCFKCKGAGCAMCKRSG